VANGAAMATFRTWVKANGGDPRALDDFSRLPGAPRRIELRAAHSGYVQGIHSRALGILAMELGAGRQSQAEVLDLGVGLRLRVQVGQWVEAGQSLLTLHCNVREGNPLPADWITLGPEPCPQPDWLLETLG